MACRCPLACLVREMVLGSGELWRWWFWLREVLVCVDLPCVSMKHVRRMAEHTSWRNECVLLIFALFSIAFSNRQVRIFIVPRLPKWRLWRFVGWGLRRKAPHALIQRLRSSSLLLLVDGVLLVVSSQHFGVICFLSFMWS